jgi:hypothetical protein
MHVRASSSATREVWATLEQILDAPRSALAAWPSVE